LNQSLVSSSEVKKFIDENGFGDDDSITRVLRSILNEVEYHCCFCKIQLQKKQVKKCGACKMAPYCSKECQIKDWKEHKIKCKSLTK
jgi:hypothetical protein